MRISDWSSDVCSSDLPGDVFFFPATYAHAVYTHAGPNLMMNFRKVTPECIYGQPVNFAQGLFSAFANIAVEKILGTVQRRHPDDKAPLLQPEQMYNKEIGRAHV